MPMFFILVMSLALQGVFEAGTKGRPVDVLVVNPNGGPLAEQVIADLKRIEGRGADRDCGRGCPEP